VAVRVKLRITSVSGKEVITSALVNSGFEVETPQLLTPRSLMRELGEWWRWLFNHRNLELYPVISNRYTYIRSMES